LKYMVPGGGEEMAELAVGLAPPPGEFVAAALVVGVEPPVEDPPEGAEDPLETVGEPPPVAPVELDDPPPHAVSSSAADTSPAAAAHPLLRITYSIPRFDPFSIRRKRTRGHRRPAAS
jgi:hypothetical protein